MHTFRQKLISQFVGILCIFLLLFNQAMATVFSFPGVEIDAKQRLIRLLPFEENIDNTLIEITEALRLNAKTSDEKWFVCNQRALDVSFSVLHALNSYAPIFNVGVLNCVVDDTTEGSDLDLFTLINTGATTFTDARRESTDQSHSDIALVFKHLMNDGSLSLQSEHTETTAPIHWHVSAIDYLANTGLIQTSHQLTLHQKSTTNRLPLRGTINANGLTLKGFSEIDALLISGGGGGSSQQNPEKPAEEKTAPKGYVHVDATPHMQTSKASDDAKPLNHPNFIWKGKVKSTEEATLDIRAGPGEAVHAVIDATFETTGLHVNVESEKSSTVTLHPKMGSSQAEDTGTPGQSNLLPQQSIFDGSGLSVAFTRPASEDSTGTQALLDEGRGNVSFGGRYAVSGDMSLIGTNNVFTAPDSEITFDKNVAMDAKTVYVDGIFARTFNNREHSFHTDADITVSETGKLYTPLFMNTKTRDNKSQIINNKGTTCLRTLEQNRHLSVINAGELEIKHARGLSKPVRIIDNTGVVQSILPLISTFSSTFYEQHHRIDEKGLKTLPVTGSLSSKGVIEIEHTRGKRLDWMQSLFASSITFKDKSNTCSAPATEIILNDNAHLHAFNDGITLNIGKLTTLPGSILEAKRHVKLLTPSSSHLQNCVLHGHIKAPLLTIHQVGLSGTGMLDIHTLITESTNAVSVDLNQFRFGKHLSNISIQNKGMFTFRRDPKAQQSNLALEMSGLFEVFAERIAMQTPLSVMRTISLHATQSNDSALSLSTDLIARESIGLESPSIHFSRDKTMSLISKDMSINNTKTPSLSIPQNVTLTVSKKETTDKEINKEGGLLSIQSPQELHITGTLSGETFYPQAPSIFIGSGKKVISEKDAKESFNGFRHIKVDGKRFNSSLPIETDTVFARVESLALSDLHTKFFDIEAKNFASFGDLSSTKPSSLTTDHMNEANRTFRGFITFNGYGEESFHHLTNIDFDDTDITQKKSTLVMSGKSHGRKLRTGPVTSVPKGSILSVDEMDNPSKQKALLLNGTVDTKQAKFVTQAEKIVIRNLLRTGGSGIFDTFIAQGDTVEIQGGLKAKHALVEGREELRLKQAQLMGLIFYLRSKHKISTQHTSADVQELGVEARDISMDDTTLTGKKHSIQAEGDLRTSHTVQNVSETSSIKAKHYEMSHSAISAKDVDVEANSASLEPGNIKATTATIKLEQYDNGIEGVIKLAHDLLHCERVHLDARKETLVITKAAPWRKNISLAVRSGDIQAPITSAGDIEIEAEQGLKIKGSIHAHNINLVANHGDLEFYKAVLDAMEDLTYEAREGNIHGQAGTYKAGNVLKGGANLGDVTEKSITERVGDSENYHTRLTQSSYTGRKIILYAGGTLHFASVRTHSKELTAFHATTFIDDVLRDERGTSWQQGKERKSESSNTAIQSQHTSVGGTYTVFTHGEQHHVAPIIDAHQIKLDGGKINLYNTQNIHQSEYSNQTKRKKESESSYSSTSVGATLKARMTLDEAAPGEAAIMITGREGGINATHARFDSSKTILSACDNTIRLMQGMNQSSYSRTMSYNSVAWNHMKSHQESHTIYSPCQFTGLLETYCDQLIVQQVEGQPLDFMSRLDAHGAQIAYEYFKEVHHFVKLHVSAPSQASIAIVGLAMSAATAGVGTSLMSAATAAGAGSSAAAAAALETLAAMSHAAITTLSTQASVALMSNDGNLGKALDSLNHSSTFKSLIASAVSAGIMHNVSLSGTDVLGRAKDFAAQTVSGTVANTIMGQNFEESIKSGAISAATNVALKSVAGAISDLCQDAPDITKHVAQGAGALGVGLVVNDGDLKKAAPYAIGAAVGSIAAEISTAKPTEEDETGGKLTEEQKQANKTSNARAPYFAQIDAILLTMALDLSEHHSQAAQAAGATFSAVRMTQERIKREKRAEEQERINAEKVAEAEKAYREQSEAEGVTAKEKEQRKLDKERAAKVAREKAARKFVSHLTPSVDGDPNDIFDIYGYQGISREAEAYGFGDDSELSQISQDALLPSYADELLSQPERPDSPRHRAANAAFDAAVKENQTWKRIEEKCAPLMLSAASQEFSKLYKDPHEAYSQTYHSVQSEIAHETALKLLDGKSVTSYELRVRDENAAALNKQIPKVMGYAYGGLCMAASVPAAIYVNPYAGVALGGFGNGLIHQAAHDYALPKTDSEWISLGLSVASGMIGASTKPVVWALGGSTIAAAGWKFDSPEHIWEGITLGAFGAFDKGAKLYSARKMFEPMHHSSALSYETTLLANDFWQRQAATTDLTCQGNRVLPQMEYAASSKMQPTFPLTNITKPSILTGLKKADAYSHDFLSTYIFVGDSFPAVNTNLPRSANRNHQFVPHAEDIRATGTFGPSVEVFENIATKPRAHVFEASSDAHVISMRGKTSNGGADDFSVGKSFFDIPLTHNGTFNHSSSSTQPASNLLEVQGLSHVQKEINALQNLRDSVQSGQKTIHDIHFSYDKFNKSAYQHNKIEDLLIKRYGKTNVESHYKIHDFSLRYEGEKKNFIGIPKEFKGTFSKPLVVVTFHKDVVPDSGRSLMWWAPISEVKNLNTVEEVMDYFALLSSWGERSHVSIAIIPAGERVKFLHGRSKLQKKEKLVEGKIEVIESRKGTGVQYAFERFDANWVEHKCNFNEFIEIVRELYL